jgi:hypothetical protein
VPVSQLHAENLDQLRTIQAEAARRLNESPVLAWLFLSDPVRALEAVGVTLSPRTVEEWRSIVGKLPAITPESFSRLRESRSLNTLVVRIRGLLPPAGIAAEPEETL